MVKMKSLTKYDMDYIVGGFRANWRNPETKKYEPYPFTPEKLAFLNAILVEETDHVLYMDNHGVNIHLCTYRENLDGSLLGFLWGASSEEQFFGDDYFSDDIVGPFEVNRKEIRAYEYSKADGSRWQG